MRIITGKLKGRKLFGPKSKDIRPALDSVKEAVFNILFDVNGKTVLDLFAGTGNVGIEALSRGASDATFVESGKEGKSLIEKNIEYLELQSQTNIIYKPVHTAIIFLEKIKKTFDLIFVDPPYNEDLVNSTLTQLAQSSLVHKGSIIIVEHNPKEMIQKIEGLELYDQRKYGQTLISFLRRI